MFVFGTSRTYLCSVLVQLQRPVSLVSQGLQGLSDRSFRSGLPTTAVGGLPFLQCLMGFLDALINHLVVFGSPRRRMPTLFGR